LKNRSATYLCCMIMFIFGMSLVITSTLLTDISKDFNLNMAQSGLFFSINFIGFIVFIFAGGILAEKYGRTRVLSFAMLGLALSLLIFGVSPYKGIAFAAAFFIGGFGGIIESIASALIADINPGKTGYYINLVQIYLCAGAVMGPVLGTAALSLGAGWRPSYYFLAVLSFLIFLMINGKKVNETPVAEKIELNKLKETILDRKFLIVCICLAFYTGSEVGAWGWMTTFLKEGMGFSIGTTAVIVSTFWISMAVGRVICGKLTQYFKPENIAAVLAFISALVVLLSGFAGSEAAVFIMTIALGMAFSSQYPFLVSIGGRFRSSTTAFSIMVGSGGVGVVIVPFIMGWIGDNFSIRAAMVSPAILFLAIGTILASGRFIHTKHA
jgi:fucose permease